MDTDHLSVNSTTAPTPAPEPYRNGRAWYVPGITWRDFPLHAQTMGMQDHLDRPYPFRSKREALKALDRIQSAQKLAMLPPVPEFVPGQQVHWFTRIDGKPRAVRATVIQQFPSGVVKIALPAQGKSVPRMVFARALRALGVA